MITLPTSYLGPVSFFKLISESPQITIEAKEYFIKQSFRSRCYIYGANGKLALSIPIQKRRNKTCMDQIRISYVDPWQKIHWKSIESAYSASPYYEFYEEELKSFYLQKDINLLLDFNQKIQNTVLNLIKLKVDISLSEDYQENKLDWRNLLHPKNNGYLQTFQIPKYIQVFEDKHGFIPNLSILDVLFNLGPRTKDYLDSIEHTN